jgi:hypothetical protein
MPKNMNKDILITILCCVLFLMAAGKAHMAIWRIASKNPTIYFFNDTLIFPNWTRDQKKHPVYHLNDSVELQFYFIGGPCKQQQILFNEFQVKSFPIVFQKIETVDLPVVVQQEKYKKFHGDLSYEFSSHSSPDTVYPGSSFNQNYVVGNIYTTISNKYPVIFHFGSLQTSVPYIHNNIDFSLQFDQQQYSSDMAEHIRKQYQDKISREEMQDSSLYRSVVSDFKNYQVLNSWLSSDKQIQELMSSSQMIQNYAGNNHSAAGISNIQSQASGFLTKDSTLTSALGNINGIRNSIQNPAIVKGLSYDSSIIHKDSVPSGNQLGKAIKFINEYNKKLQALRKLGKEKDSLAKQYDSVNQKLQSGKDSLDNMLKADVKEVAGEYEDSSHRKNASRWLLGIKQLGIGRSFIDYSQLSAKNISLFGINAEYCDHYYFALAAGKTDFIYQDFLTATPIPKQMLFLARFGLGEKESKHLYFTFYTGSKQASYYVNNQPTTTKLSGFTIEANIPVSKNIYITGEVGKSTSPSYIQSSEKPAALTAFNDRNNEAYSLQVKAYFPKTDTRLLAVYNRYGIYFQSFNIYSSNSTSTSWQFRLDQYLFKKKLSLTASVRKNDYTNPFIFNNYKTESLIYAFQSTLRIRKYPTLTLAYLPFSQLTILQGQITENRFYTLLGSASYAYRIKRVFMNSSVVYTQYFNNSNQTGFIYYNAQSWFFNQSVLIQKFTLGAAATFSHSVGYHLFSTGPFVQWAISNSLSVGGGVKYNNLNGAEVNFGYNGNVNCQVGKWGRFGISYERGYIPSQNDLFFRNNWGRATYSKNF